MTMTQQTKGTPLHLQEGQAGAAGLRDRLLRQLGALWRRILRKKALRQGLAALLGAVFASAQTAIIDN